MGAGELALRHDDAHEVPGRKAEEPLLTRELEPGEAEVVGDRALPPLALGRTWSMLSGVPLAPQ